MCRQKRIIVIDLRTSWRGAGQIVKSDHIYSSSYKLNSLCHVGIGQDERMITKYNGEGLTELSWKGLQDKSVIVEAIYWFATFDSVCSSLSISAIEYVSILAITRRFVSGDDMSLCRNKRSCPLTFILIIKA